jgi:ubiquinone/menaquinone biosynthesis C-methylase UbiE
MDMSKSQNMLSTVTPWEMVAEGYAETTMKLFRSYTEKALEVANISRESAILDVACGPGTLPLLAAAQVNSVHAIDFSESMVKLFKEQVEAGGLKNIEIHCGDGQELPFSNEMFDLAFSMFGLMFFPDRNKGYSEIYRTLKPGGKILISSWAPVSESPVMQTMFGALKAMKPEIPEPQSDIESLENPEFFRTELQNAGFNDVEILPVAGEYPITDLQGFWRDMVKGSAPIVMLKKSMSPEEWEEKERVALDYLQNTLPSLPTSLYAKAWLGCGVK